MESNYFISKRRMRHIVIGWSLTLGVAVALIAIYSLNVRTYNILYIGLLVILFIGQFMVQSGRIKEEGEDNQSNHIGGCH